MSIAEDDSETRDLAARVGTTLTIGDVARQGEGNADAGKATSSSLASSSSSSAAVGTAGVMADDQQSIGDSFAEAQRLQEKLKDMMATDGEYSKMAERALSLMQRVDHAVRNSDIFSPNEVIEDVKTVDLTYIMCPYLLAELNSSIPGIEGRLPRVKTAIALYKRFLDHCESLLIMAPSQKAAYHRTGEPDAATRRQEKIDRFKQDKADTEKLKVLRQRREERRKSGVRDEDVEEDEQERDYTMLLITSKINKAMDNLAMSQQEIGFLEHREKMMKDAKFAEEQRQTEEHKRSKAKKPTMTVVTKDQLSGNVMTQNIDLNSQVDIAAHIAARKNPQASVFRDPNPPTRTEDEQFAIDIATGEIPMPEAPAREPRDMSGWVNHRPAGDGIIENKDEDSDPEPETNAEANVKTMEQREWDAYTDEHERGAGNKHKNW